MVYHRTPSVAPESLRPLGRKAGRTYDALVSATCQVIVATGGFSGETVAEKAGLATATFYAYFSTKEDALARTRPPNGRTGRYQPSDTLIAWLEAL